MVEIKRIALIISASNFERQKNIVKAVHRTLREMGGYALYVFSNYGLFRDDMGVEDCFHGEDAIYDLLERGRFDGCILEGNVENKQLAALITERLSRRGIPVVTINIEAPGAPFVNMNTYGDCCRLMEHLIDCHHCRRINLVLNWNKDEISMQALKAYGDMLKRFGLPLEEKRVLYRKSGLQNGRNLYGEFAELGIQDSDAVICAHDVLSMGLCMELEDRGLRVPEDMILCSLNYSVNSAAFRPEITGIDRLDEKGGREVCYVLRDLMEGRKVPTENYYAGRLHYCASCGCREQEHGEDNKKHQEVIVAKVEAGNQISQMMQYNNALEEVTSLEQLAENIRDMMLGISCRGFFCCLNQGDLKYILNQEPDHKTVQSRAYDDIMVAVTGSTGREGEIKNRAFDIGQLAPVEVREGDILIFYPIHHKGRDFGYMVFLNEYLPIEIYNYRICHTSIGISIENLHRQMILRSSIDQLDRLHMRDQMTGLHNRFGLERFQENYTAGGQYCTVMLDMDGLKGINDNFGHLEGNHAICVTAEAIRDLASKEDLLVRYGGDEFLILSHNREEEHWDALREELNRRLKEYTVCHKLPYILGISLGYAVSGRERILSLDESYELADRAMYENKKLRKRA